MNYLAYLVREIHSTVVATVDDAGLPVTCAIDMMDCDGQSLYFLTAKGKAFYDRLKKRGAIALTGMKGADTLSCVAISIQAKVREIGPGKLPELFEKNPYMNQIYPNAQSRGVLTVFQAYQGVGEWFDLSRLPIERDSFAFGGAEAPEQGYLITDHCTGCGLCAEKCPQRCIDLSRRPAVINQHACIHCGNCSAVCPEGAVERCF